MASVPDVTTLLSEVEEAPVPHAARFDDGGPLTSRLAILPSAFNPPTLAHLALLDAARHFPDVESAAALLTTRNVAKGLTGASFEDRIGMLLAARSQAADLAVLATNQARIIDQEAALALVYPGLAFDFVVGYDTLIRLFDGRYYTDMRGELAPFFARTRIIALNRGEADVGAVAEFVAREAGDFAGQILVAELDPETASLSSTLARTAFEHGEQTDIVPAGVAAYIEGRGLYRD